MYKIRISAAVSALFALAACATYDDAPANSDLWTAHGYLTPGPTGEPEIIGTFSTEGDCMDAVDEWMSRQVVGNPVSGECLPVDQH